MAPQAKRLPDSLRQALNMDRATSVRQRPLNFQVTTALARTTAVCREIKLTVGGRGEGLSWLLCPAG